jgi:signal transduction histidine kinase/CheY-like chemotaxis protein
MSPKPIAATSLARRFALAAAGLAAAALLLTSLAAWWLINQQHEQGLKELAAREREFRAQAVGSDLTALASRMSEIAGSTILATGLVDSAGRETYLVPFLGGVRQINGVPVQVLLTDFEGKEIASNSATARFSEPELAWFRGELPKGRPEAAVFPSLDHGDELVAFAPMLYERTSSPEGAVLYKIALKDVMKNISAGGPVRLEWGFDSKRRAADGEVPVPVPPVFQPLQFRVRGDGVAAMGGSLAPQYLTIFGIAAMLASIVVLAGVRIAKLLTADLQRLEAFSSRFVGSGLSSERVPVQGSAEVASLADSINQMLDRLNEQHETLLIEREKLTQLTEALKAADRRKDDFLAMLAHELRNPLAPIATGAELLRRLPDIDPRVARTSEVIARQASHMTKLVSDLLDVSRVTRGLVTLDFAEVDLVDVVHTAVEQIRPLAESHHHELVLELPPEPVVVRGDRARLVQVTSNLLNNAAKYTPDQGRIVVTLAVRGRDALLKVADNGIGITPELMPDIFDLFTQGSRGADRAQGGLGLGLALVKHLVELHSGRVQAESAGPNQGSVFTVQLPLAIVRTARAPGEGPRATRGTAQALHLLVVDDNTDAANTLARWLEFEGHKAEVAHDGPSALHAARNGRYDAYILDIGLPVMDGMELARRLRAMPEVQGATLVALTGYGQRSDKQQTAEAGFRFHLVKPASPESLRAVLDEVEPLSRSADTPVAG